MAEDIKKPITIEEARKLSDKKVQEQLELDIFKYTECLNKHIINAVEQGYDRIFLFEFYALPKEDPNKILNAILEDSDSYPKVVKEDWCDSDRYFRHKRAFVKALQSFEKIGYKMFMGEGFGWTVSIIKTKRFLKKPVYHIGLEDNHIREALGCPNSSESIEALLDDTGHIRLNSYKVFLSWK